MLSQKIIVLNKTLARIEPIAHEVTKGESRK